MVSAQRWRPSAQDSFRPEIVVLQRAASWTVGLFSVAPVARLTLDVPCDCTARKMAILVPALDPKTGKPMCGKVKLLDEFKRTGQSTESLVALVNKSPGTCLNHHPSSWTYSTRSIRGTLSCVHVSCCWQTVDSSGSRLVAFGAVWDAVKNMYILDFRGRVTQASIRNFQAVRAENGERPQLLQHCLCMRQIFLWRGGVGLSGVAGVDLSVAWCAPLTV